MSVFARRGGKWSGSSGPVRAVLMGLVLALTLVACGGGEQTTPDGSETGSPDQTSGPSEPGDEPRAGGTLNVGMFEEVPSQDPHTSRTRTDEMVFNAVYESLVRFDASADFVPGIAESWEVSDDLLTYTFHLRDGVMFHNGRELIAEDVKWNLERIIDPDVGALNAGVLPITSVEAPDDSTVVVTLSAANSDRMYFLNWPGRQGLMAPESVNEAGEVVEAIGAGPFKMVEYSPTEIVIERNDDYYGEVQPLVDDIRFVALTDPVARLSALTGGEIDVALNVPAVEANNTAGIEVQEVNDSTASLWNINVRRPPFDNRDLRYAMQLAISRSDIAEAAYDGFAVPTDTIFHPLSVWYPDRDVPTDADMDEARRLVEQSGVDISQVDVTLLMYDPPTFSEAELVASAWKELGFRDVIMDRVDFAQIVERLGAGDWDVNIAKPSGAVAPDRIYYYYDLEPEWRNGLAGFINNEEATEQLTTARTTADVDERKAAYQRLDEIGMHEVASTFFTVREQSFNALQPYVKGWDQSQHATQRIWWTDGGLLTVWLDQ